jgi:hypothetical protein
MKRGREGGREGGMGRQETYLALADVVDQGRDDAHQIHCILFDVK